MSLERLAARGAVLQRLPVPRADAIPGLVADARQGGAEWLYIPPDTFLNEHRAALTAAALNEGLPSFSASERFVGFADALGLDPVIAATDLGRWQPPAGRGTRERIVLDVVDDIGFDLIDDAFNANPASLTASLEVLIAATPQDGIGAKAKGRRIAILTEEGDGQSLAEALERIKTEFRTRLQALAPELTMTF